MLLFCFAGLSTMSKYLKLIQYLFRANDTNDNANFRTNDNGPYLLYNGPQMTMGRANDNGPY